MYYTTKTKMLSEQTPTNQQDPKCPSQKKKHSDAKKGGREYQYDLRPPPFNQPGFGF
tara:strand:+ start:203 stop:373 length:171 start_codon:yes stop_codon:yes gene_type:complete